MNQAKPRISVAGTGYVGLVTAVCFAELGFEVFGYDIVDEKIARLRQGHCPIYEPQLPELLTRALASGRIRFGSDLQEAIAFGDVIFVCVGTPELPDGRADLSQVEAIARQIAETMQSYKLVVEKSTVPVQTTQWIRRTIELYAGRNAEFDVASNPEFLREGSAVHDFLNPDRVVIGVESERARQLLLSLYAPLKTEVLVTDVNTAEIIKHASNSFLATKISFINMVADLCERVGANVTEVARGMGLDSRIGPKFLQAGVGYGGSCFPKDVRAFLSIGQDNGADFQMLRAVDAINNNRIAVIADKLRQALWVLKGKTIAVWGLAFKPNTDDIREAPALKLIDVLLAEGASIQAWDPQAVGNVRKKLGDAIAYADSPLDAARGANAVLVMTEWDDLRALRPADIKSAMRTPIIVDARNYLDAAAYTAAGFELTGVGLGKSPSPART